MHNGNIIPVLGRYLLVAGWYYGGTSVVDFTNPAQPQEVAYYDFDSPSGESWSSYWYNGRIYSNDMNRGVDVFSMVTPYSAVRPAVGAPERPDAGRPLPAVDHRARPALPGALRRPDGPSKARQDT